MPVKLSIITINLDNAAGLQKTMASVFMQTFKNYEYIVIDGGSSDESIAEIEKHTQQLAYWVSEKDKGVYNAMNKGIQRSTGEYLLFLNSGDFLLENNSLYYFFEKDYDQDVLCADIRMNDHPNYWIKKAPDTLSFDFFTTDTLPHQSALIKKELFNRVGLYDESLRFVSDWKFYLNAFCKFDATYLHLPVVTTQYEFRGISSVADNAAALHQERNNVLQTEYALFYADYLELHQCRASLRNYSNSRLHNALSRMMKWPVYKLFKK